MVMSNNMFPTNNMRDKKYGYKKNREEFLQYNLVIIIANLRNYQYTQ